MTDRMNVKSFSSSFKDVGIEYLHKHMDWITRKLMVQSSDDIVRIRPQDWMGDFIMMALKHLHFRNHPGIVNNHINSIALALGNKIESIETKEGVEANEIEFFQAQKVGEWYANASEYLLSVKLLDLGFPFIVYNEPVAIYNHTGDSRDILVSKLRLDEFVTYFQAEEKKSSRIIVNVFGQKTYTIKPMEWDNLTLDESIDFLIKRDLETFLQKKDWFSGKGIPYRRGYLLHGPPGNGKTTVIRAMLTQAKLPAFTIKKMYDPDAMYYFEDMFEAASRSGGAFIILEDIDRSFSEKAGTNESYRSAIPFSVFLNCLDGISDADGVIVIATANSPQMLDKAILERPGRFDRVVNFPNPAEPLRKQYLSSHLPGFQDDALQRMAVHCANMSFAQLREIYIIASQLADDQNHDVTEKDVIDAYDRLISYMKKAGVRESGYKT